MKFFSKKTHFPFILFAFFFLFSIWPVLRDKMTTVEVQFHASPGIKKTVSMTKNERDHLEYFFRSLLLLDKGIYTLLGNKPLSMGEYIPFFCMKSGTAFYHSIWPDNCRTYWGWKTWKKYRKHFSVKSFVMWEEENPKFEGSQILFFANKSLTQSIVQKHSQDFSTVLNPDHANSFDEIASQATFFKHLHKREDLIGTLLGYGRENSIKFQKMDEGEEIDLEYVWKNRKDLSGIPVSMVSLFYHPITNLESDVFCPDFSADLSSDETKQLQKSYEETRTHIIQVLTGKDFLTTVLELLVEKPS